MKLILSLLSLLIYVNLQAQNVGIGTNRPLSKLHVAGDIRVDSLARDSGVVLHDKNGLLTSLKFTGNKKDVLRG